MSQRPGEDPARERKMDTFNNMISNLLNKRPPKPRTQSVSPKIARWTNSCLPPPTNEGPHVKPDDSPTPKRRKVAQSSPLRKQESFDASLHRLKPVDPSALSLDSSNTRLSPAQKTVAFSDRVDEVDSSPTQRNIESSPRHSSPSRPSKSILRNAAEVERPGSDMTQKSESLSKLAGRDDSPTGHFTTVDPSSLEFWAGGEVHNLRDVDNVKEFKKLLEGGLKILARNDSNSVARRFEIYATFNTIMPVLPARNVSDVLAKKTAVVVRNLDKIVGICLPQLKSEQEKLLNAEEKKDPFVSRLYIQIVRFFGFLLINFRILTAVAANEVLKEKLKTVFDLSFDALTHPNSNKAIITAQFSLLADDKFGPYFLQDKEVDKMIAAILGTKEIPSSNLICEKLLLMKSLITNYTGSMLQIVSTWLPREVLSRTIIEDDTISLTVLQTAVSILLLLLKKSIDSPAVQQDIIKCIRSSYAKDVLPEIFTAKDLSHSSLTLEELVQKQIMYLIIQRNEYKLAMDFWLAMMGLLYNTPGTLVELSESDAYGWLKLNRVCFLSGHSEVRLVALKAWRIITYCTWCHINGKSTSQDLKLVRLLEKPFEFKSHYHSDPNVSEGLLYHLTGLLYTTCGTFHKPEMFKFFWDKLITPIYCKYIFKSKNILLRSRAIKLLLRLIGNNIEGRSHKLERKRPPAIKVISSAGATPKDIRPVPPELLQGTCETVMKLIFEAIRSDLACWSTNYDLFNSLVEEVPSELVNQKHFTDFLQLAVELSNVGKSPNAHDMFLRLSSAVVGPFGDLIFSDKMVFLKLIQGADSLSGPYHDFKLRLLKELSRALKGKVSDFRINDMFLQIGDPLCKKYISNWIGSVLLSPDLSQVDVYCLKNIVKILRSSEAIKNLLAFYSKSALDGNLFEQLNLKDWNDEEYMLFFRSFQANSISYLEDSFENELKRTLPQREEVFRQVAPSLIELKSFSLIKEVVNRNLRLANDLLPKYASFCSLILPIERLPDLMSMLHTFSEDAQFTILKWALDSDAHQTLFERDITFPDIMFQPGSDGYLTNEGKNIVSQALEKLYDCASWGSLSECIKRCIKCHQESLIIKLFMEKGIESLGSLSSIAITAMAGLCGPLNSAIDEFMSKALRDKNVDFALELARDLLESEKFLSLHAIKEDFLSLLIADSRSFSESQLSKSKEILKSLMRRLTDYPEELVFSFVRCMLNTMTGNMTPNAQDVIDFIAQHQELRQSIFNESVEYHEVLKKFQIHHNGKLSVSEGDKSPGKEGAARCEKRTRHLNGPRQANKPVNELENNVAKNPENRLHVQVPATQGNENDTTRPAAHESLNSSPAVLPSFLVKGAGSSPATDEFERLNGTDKKEDGKGEATVTDALSERQLRCKPINYSGSKSPPDAMGKIAQNSKETNSLNIGISDVPEKVFRGRRNRYSLRASDDFADVQMDNEDELLKTLEEDLNTKTSSLAKKEIPGKREPETANILATTGGTEDAEGGSKIRFPIFNFSKVNGTTTGNDSQVKRSVETHIVKSIKTEDNVSQSRDVPIEDLSRLGDIVSQEATPSLRIHFPSKKVRRLVNRMRTFTLEDFSAVTLEEKRNLRIEMLGFLLNLEHDEESVVKDRA